MPQLLHFQQQLFRNHSNSLGIVRNTKASNRKELKS